jgi:RNA-directed DNA polymerase
MPSYDQQLAPKAIHRFKERVRKITLPARGGSMDQMIQELARYTVGWRGCFGFCETRRSLEWLDSWIRRRVRCAFWRQRKTGRKRYAELARRGVHRDLALRTAGEPGGPVARESEPGIEHGIVECLPEITRSPFGG